MHVIYLTLVAELLERVSEDNVEYRREIIHVIEQSYKDPESINRLIHSRAFRVRNSQLLNEVGISVRYIVSLKTSNELINIGIFLCLRQHSVAVGIMFLAVCESVCVSVCLYILSGL